MPRIRMRKSLVGENGRDWFAGTEQVASKAYADYCVRRGAAVFVDAGETVAPAPPLTTDAIVNRAESPAHRDPVSKPTTPRRRR